MNLKTKRILYAVLPILVPVAIAFVLAALPPQASSTALAHQPLFGPKGGGRGI